VLFIPSVQRDGVTPIDQPLWVQEAMTMLGTVFGGATAYPRAKGVWRDNERGGALVFDEPVVMHCYAPGETATDNKNLGKLAAFCRRMGRETQQGEIGVVIAGEYFGISNFEEQDDEER
jgi:hypothetical protein